MPVAVAAFTGAVLGAGLSFAINKYLAFRDHSPIASRQVGAFIAVALGTALLMALSMQLVAVGFGVPYLLAKAICAITLFFTWSLPAQRRWVFQRSEVSARPPSIDTRSPVIHSASSLTMKVASAAISSAVPGRPSGWVSRDRARNVA